MRKRVHIKTPFGGFRNCLLPKYHTGIIYLALPFAYKISLNCFLQNRIGDWEKKSQCFFS